MGVSPHNMSFFLDTRGLGWAKFVESAQESVWEEGGEIGDRECVQTTCCWVCGGQQAWVIMYTEAEHDYIMSGIRHWRLGASQSLDTDVTTFNKFGHHFYFLKLHCLPVLLWKSSVSMVTEAETIQVNTETTRPQITHL